jgi:hypothetical protein
VATCTLAGKIFEQGADREHPRQLESTSRTGSAWIFIKQVLTADSARRGAPTQVSNILATRLARR